MGGVAGVDPASGHMVRSNHRAETIGRKDVWGALSTSLCSVSIHRVTIVCVVETTGH